MSSQKSASSAAHFSMTSMLQGGLHSLWGNIEMPDLWLGNQKDNLCELVQLCIYYLALAESRDWDLTEINKIAQSIFSSLFFFLPAPIAGHDHSLVNWDSIFLENKKQRSCICVFNLDIKYIEWAQSFNSEKLFIFFHNLTVATLKTKEMVNPDFHYILSYLPSKLLGLIL